MESIKRFIREEEGATAIEYGLLAGLIVAAIAGTVTTIGGQVSALFTNTTTALPAAS